jgi:hypothetical protein
MSSLVLFSILISVLLVCAGESGNFAFAKPYDQQIKITKEKTKLTEKAKALAEEARNKILEKTLKDSKSKKEDAKKQIALEAKKKLDIQKNNLKLEVYRFQ